MAQPAPITAAQPEDAASKCQRKTSYTGALHLSGNNGNNGSAPQPQYTRAFWSCQAPAFAQTAMRVNSAVIFFSRLVQTPPLERAEAYTDVRRRFFRLAVEEPTLLLLLPDSIDLSWLKTLDRICRCFFVAGALGPTPPGRRPWCRSISAGAQSYNNLAS